MDVTGGQALWGAKQSLEAGEGAVGGKAYGLARLGEFDARVPEWRVVPASACIASYQSSGLSEKLVAVIDELQGVDATTEAGRAALNAASTSARPLVESAALDERLQKELSEWLQSMGPGRWAVRSSMVGEDSETASFAGQLDSYLFQSPDDVVDAIKKCWGSAFSPHALLYRMKAGFTGIPQVAVVIQRMVEGDVSGVAFTAHPVTGRRDQCLITGAWGLGEGIVSGICNTDEFIWGHDNRGAGHTLAEKDVAVRPNADGSPGTCEVPVPEDQWQVPCLNEANLAKLGRELIRLHQAFDAPMDVEWTLAGGGFYILQARPITSLPPEPDTQAPVIVFDNSNIQESYCGVTTPLTFSFAQRAYASVYEQTARVLGQSEAAIQRLETVFENLLGLVAGRVYYNINNWYRGLQILPSFGQNKADMERMMGLEEPVDFVEDEALSFGEKLMRAPRVIRTLFKLLGHFRRLKTEVPMWLQRFENNYVQIARDGLKDAPLSVLMRTLDQIDTQILDDWHTPIINDFYVMMSVGKLRRALEKGGVEDPDDLVNRLLAGEEDIESTQPVRQLMGIATLIRNDPKLTERLNELAPEQVVETLSAEHSELNARFEHYIERYGDRCMGELKLETITLREDTSFIGQVLQGYVGREDLVPEMLSAREKALRTEAEQSMKQSLSGWALRRARKTLNNARAAVKNREAMRLARTRVFGLYRAAYQGIGKRLQERGALQDGRQIFYLTTQEIKAFHEGRAVTADLAPVAEARRQEYEAYESVEVPHRIVASSPVYLNMPEEEPDVDDATKDARILKGIGCYPGVVEEAVKVVRSPQDELNLNGKVLTALRTDPGWAPLFPTCSAILIERGSTLSHSAVVARELGIPAVVGVKHLLKIVEDGERVRIDGEKGLATRLDQPESGA